SAVLAGGFALAAVALPVFAGLRVKPDPGDPWRLGPVYVLILAASAFVCGTSALLAFLRRRRAEPARPPWALLLAAGSTPLALVLFALAPAAARAGFAKGLGFIGSTDKWLATLDEFQPVDSTAQVAAMLPAALVGLAGAIFAIRDRRWRALPIAVPFLVLVPLALVQKRFLCVAVAFGAAAAGAGVTAARRKAMLVVGLAAALVSVPRDLAFAGVALRGESLAGTSSGEGAAAMVRELTPAPTDPPEWGVLAPWDYGHA